MKAPLWPVGPTWGNTSLYSPSCLSCLFSVWVHPGAPRCECQCHVSSIQTHALCSLRTTLTWATVTRNQDKPERLDSLFSDGDGKNKIPYIHQTSAVMRLLFLSVISYHLTCFYLKPITVSIIFSRLQTRMQHRSQRAFWRHLTSWILCISMLKDSLIWWKPICQPKLIHTGTSWWQHNKM